MKLAFPLASLLTFVLPVTPTSAQGYLVEDFEDGDANGDGRLDEFDLLDWQREFGASQATGSQPAAHLAPEPTAASLLGVAALLLVAQTRGRRAQQMVVA